jgi:putative membrane protein (TIGR04086 family)
MRGTTMELSDRALFVTETVGLVAAVVGGYVAARMAGDRHVQHGLAVGIVAFVIWFAVDLLFPGEVPMALAALLSLVAIIPAGALGGFIARRAHGSVRHHPPASQ